MKWMYNIEQKIKVAGLFAVIFVSIFTVNRLESSRINEMGASMDSVYKDRLVAKNYLFNLSGLLYEKKSTIDEYRAADDPEPIADYLRIQNRAINELIIAYSKTKLTPEEQTLFGQLQNQIDAIARQESELVSVKKPGRSEQVAQLNNSYNSVNATLSDLSNLQLYIGKSANERAQQILAGSNLLTHFELALLVVIGLLIHALVFASRSIRGKLNQPHHLN